MNILRYSNPAKAWVEALPLGNGRLGAMVFGGTSNEHLQLNEATLWSGGPKEWNNPGAKSVLPKVRKAIMENRLKYADALCRKMQGPSTQSYQTLGDCYIDFGLDRPVTNYERTLNLEQAICTSKFKVGGVIHHREVFVSSSDDVILIRLRVESPGSLSFQLKLTTPHPSVINRDCADITISGCGPSLVDPPNHTSGGEPIQYDEKKGTRFCVRARLKINNGSARFNKEYIEVSEAAEALIFISAATCFAGFDVDPSNSKIDPKILSRTILETAFEQDFDSLLKRHVQYHSNLFNRVKLDLGSNEEKEKLDSNERVARYAKGEPDPGLEVLLFQFGRYLLISSSRPGGQPATLQGIWNHEIRPPWCSAHTININSQMNYWPAETSALPEMHEPMLQMVRELSVNGKITAQVNYGARGWVSHHGTDIWRQTGPLGDYGSGSPVWANWALSGPWLCRHLFEHFLFNQDINFLQKSWPIMRGAAEFCLDWLIKDSDSDYLITAPSASPEHAFILPDGTQSTITKAVAMDMQIIHDHFNQCIETCRLLNIDQDFAKELRVARDRLFPIQIGARGNILEWTIDYKDTEPHHRHVSQLYGLYPGTQFTPDNTVLFQSARKTLELRGDDGTGWSIGWKICFWARLQDGDHAHDLMKYILRPVSSDQTGFGLYGGVYLNLFDAHPPFQIDGNFGFTAGVAEMLLQSHQQRDQRFILDLLPALPKAWVNGEIHGLRARGGFGIEMQWKSSTISRCILKSIAGNPCIIRYRNREINIDTKPGELIEVNI